MSEHWPIVPLSEVLHPVSRPEPVDPQKSYRILGAHWYAKGLYVKDMLPGSEIRADKVYRVEERDFVYNRLFAWKGSFAIATKENDGCYVSNEFPCFTINRERAEGYYLWRYFSRTSAWEEALGLSTGGTPTSRNRLKENKLLAMKIPLPPLSEQRRIVARIEELAAKIEEAHAFRQCATEEANALGIAGRGATFARCQEQFGSLRLEDLATRITKGESPEWQGFTYQDAGPLFIRSENVLWGKLDTSNAVRIPEPFHQKLSRSQLRSGDVLINLVGASIGRTCVVPEPIGAANINQAVAVITPKEKELLSEFLMHFLLSSIAQDVIHSGKVETARPNISLGDLRELEIPTPPLVQQRRVLAELDTLQAKVESLKRFQAETAAELDAMLPSILDKAFKGRL